VTGKATQNLPNGLGQLEVSHCHWDLSAFYSNYVPVSCSFCDTGR